VPDVGFTHVALIASDTDASAAFYREYADMAVVHRRPSDTGDGDVVWLSDGTRPFVIVLLPGTVPHPLGAMSHLGVGCESREEVDRRLARARAEGRPVVGPTDSGYPVGYWGLIEDPDGHTLELAHGQEVGLTVERADLGPPP
jgi:catechol 2,3-dioxygenase-like lactoylglutathione lyase family enzyme